MRFLRFISVIGVLIVTGLILSASPGHADFYKWVDENGTIWLTDDPKSLPEESQGKFEKVMTTEELPESPASEGVSSSAVVEGGETPAVGAKLEEPDQDLEEKDRLKKEISMLEQNLAAARRALRRVPLTDRRGYWFVVDRETGKKVLATYKDPGAIWATQTWPALPRSERTSESEERRRIQSDIEKFERDLGTAKRELSTLSVR